MADRLFVAVIGSRNAGKSTSWYKLFGSKVKTKQGPRNLQLDKQHSTEVYLISGSLEERKLYAKNVLADVSCRIVLCSVQYVEDAFERTWNHVFEEGFAIYAQWLNPEHTGEELWDRMGLVNVLLTHNAVVSIRDGRNGKHKLTYRTEEIRQYIHGWASARGLVS